MKFILFHGSFGSPEENWFPELRERLLSLKQEVIAPQFPVEDWDDVTKKGPNISPQHQSLDTWLKAFEPTLKEIKPSDSLCFIGHSLGPLFILHVLEKYNLKLDSAIFVSPFLRKLNKTWQIDHVNKTFYKTDFDFKKLKSLVPTTYVLYSNNDPYVEQYHSIGFAKRLGSSLLFVKNAEHMSGSVNLVEFPLIFELCKTRLDLSLYQKYLAHRKELYAVDYIDPKSEEVLYLEPHEVYDEGVFKFRNLRKSGFCTFLASLTFWDTQAVYYQQARLSAKRIKDFTRVFVITKADDLKNPKLIEHIQLDLEAGIKIYLISFAEIEKITSEPDFGLWDNEYLCAVMIENGTPTKVRLSSRKKDIAQALEWQKQILKVAMPIHSIHDMAKDIDEFKKKLQRTPSRP